MTTTDLAATIAAGRHAFGNVLAGLPDPDWNAPSLCSGSVAVDRSTRRILQPMAWPEKLCPATDGSCLRPASVK